MTPVAVDTSARMDCAWRRNCCPSGVIFRPRACRWKSDTPRMASRSLIDSVTALCEIERVCAAPLTVPCSAAATKYRIWRRVMDIAMFLDGVKQGVAQNRGPRHSACRSAVAGSDLALSASGAGQKPCPLQALLMISESSAIRGGRPKTRTERTHP